MFIRVVIPGKFEYQRAAHFRGSVDEWKEFSSEVTACLVGMSQEHPTMPRVFVDPTGLHFSVHKSKGSLAMTRTEVYENE